MGRLFWEGLLLPPTLSCIGARLPDPAGLGGEREVDFGRPGHAGAMVGARGRIVL
jgi:hypothetical protein